MKWLLLFLLLSAPGWTQPVPRAWELEARLVVVPPKPPALVCTAKVVGRNRSNRSIQLRLPAGLAFQNGRANPVFLVRDVQFSLAPGQQTSVPVAVASLYQDERPGTPAGNYQPTNSREFGDGSRIVKLGREMVDRGELAASEELALIQFTLNSLHPKTRSERVQPAAEQLRLLAGLDEATQQRRRQARELLNEADRLYEQDNLPAALNDAQACLLRAPNFQEASKTIQRVREKIRGQNP